MDEFGYVIPARETGDQFVLVFVNAAFQVIGYAGLEGFGFIRHNVDVIVFHKPSLFVSL